MLQIIFNYLRKNQVIFALFIILFLWLIFQIRVILLTLFLAYIIMAAMLPIVEFLRKRKVPKTAAVVITYLSIVLILILLILPLIPFIYSQIELLITGFPKYLDKSARFVGVHLDAKSIQTYFNAQLDLLSKSAFDVTSKIFGGIFSGITIFIVSFYLLMYNDVFKRFIANMFAKEYHGRVLRTVGLVNDKLGAWLQGQMTLCLAIGTISYLALTALGIPFAPPLAMIAGILEAIPTLGPILSAIPAAIVALTISPQMALVVVFTYWLIQMLENQLLVPKIMQRAVGLNPVIVIIGVTIGANLMGAVGALLAIPFISLIIVIYKSIEAERNTTD